MSFALPLPLGLHDAVNKFSAAAETLFNGLIETRQQPSSSTVRAQGSSSSSKRFVERVVERLCHRPFPVFPMQIAAVQQMTNDSKENCEMALRLQGELNRLIGDGKQLKDAVSLLTMRLECIKTADGDLLDSQGDTKMDPPLTSSFDPDSTKEGFPGRQSSFSSSIPHGKKRSREETHDVATPSPSKSNAILSDLDISTTKAEGKALEPSDILANDMAASSDHVDKKSRSPDAIECDSLSASFLLFDLLFFS